MTVTVQNDNQFGSIGPKWGDPDHNYIAITANGDLSVNGVTVAGASGPTLNITGSVSASSDITADGGLVASTGNVRAGSGNIVATAGSIYGPKVKLTPEGGIAVKLTNKTGSASVAGNVVSAHGSVNNAVALIVKDVPAPIGVFYESGIADGAEAWVVVAGIADVYFTGNVSLGNIARGFITADGASYVAGQALNDTIPNPLSDDKHFYEIGHCLAARTGAGLAKVCLHFN